MNYRRAIVRGREALNYRRGFFRAWVLLALALAIFTVTAQAEAQQALTCRFEYEQSIERSDLSSPRPVSRPMAQPKTYTLIFNDETRTGTYTHDYGSIGTHTGEVVLLRGDNRLTFYENVPSSDNIFVLTAFTKEKLPDGRYPAVMSSHSWWSGVRDTTGNETFLPSQVIGGCR